MQKTLLPLALLAALAAGCHEPSSSDSMNTRVSSSEHPATASDEENERDVPLDELPAIVRKAALAAVPGLVIEEAELEMEHGAPVYSIEGSAENERVEVEVAPDGTVLEVERGADDDEHEQGDDDDMDMGDDD